YKKQHFGLSLVELLVAITIGALLLTAATSLLVNNKRIYQTQNMLGRVQETARFSVARLVNDISMGGYFGCSGDLNTVTNNLNGVTSGSTYDVANPVEGFENGGNWQPSNTATGLTLVAGTDGITIRHMSGATYNIATPYVDDVSDDVFVDAASGIQANDYVVISDCKSTDIFRATSVTEIDDDTDGNADRLQIKHAAGSGNNTTANLGNKYTDDAGRSARMIVRRYYIATGANGPGLFMNGEELVEGVTDMEIVYGINSDGDADADADSYVNADVVGATNWANVVSVKITLTFTALNEDFRDIQSNDWTYTTTVRIRNNTISI
ncbi:MAG: PilW family protein, partial [Proteobacteria bacterium]|nr:PilW family protein [Pseudomonadota bacterium]